MNSAIKKGQHRLRESLIEHLRPGRDEAELLSVLGRAEAVQSDGQRSMLEQVVAFNDTRVREVMVPRSQIHAVNVDASLAEVEVALIEYGVTRLVVMEADIDHVLGVVHIQDVLAARVRGEEPSLTTLMRPCLRVLELEQVPGLLEEMRDHSCHIAMVLDEYGGTAGLVTLSDLLHEIVGEIGEEGEDESECQLQADGSYMVEAHMHIEDLIGEIGVQLPLGDYDTVGGWITASLARIPKRGETAMLDGFQVHIIEADPRRITKVRMIRLQDIKKNTAGD
ncbi:CBS domain-containing protein [Mariprofundus aestuarium]|uniref:CBS domain-containing protein n=1 Tax=Mariprofundus aestuarium TaxID=1921086 RepID=A0A2K8KV98_MARES|nr:transporter associated domain-containing protein [Mariprofundus aestuarium]ATX78653.1 CBS domain-containing protein [Mariprofundus aestuarium]